MRNCRLHGHETRGHHAHRGFEEARVPGLRLGGHRLARRRRNHFGGEAGGQGGRARTCRRRPALVCLLRHRAHALGHARQALGGQRASAPGLHGKNRCRAQRHHRKLHPAARRAGSRWPRLQKRHGQRGGCAPARALLRRRHRGGLAPRGRASGGRLCAGRRARRPPGPHRRHAQRLARGRGVRARRADGLRGLGRRRLHRPHARRGLSRRRPVRAARADRHHVPRSRRHPLHPACHARGLGRGRCGKGRLSRLHAQGNLRAAPRRARHHRWQGEKRPRAPRRV